MAKTISNYEIIVGNIGTVYRGTSRLEAFRIYHAYVELSKTDTGRGGDEPVTMMRDGDIAKEYEGIRILRHSHSDDSY